MGRAGSFANRLFHTMMLIVDRTGAWKTGRILFRLAAGAIFM